VAFLFGRFDAESIESLTKNAFLLKTATSAGADVVNVFITASDMMLITFSRLRQHYLVGIK
jgi:hypothetical protein